jgi:hypothetical protein
VRPLTQALTSREINPPGMARQRVQIDRQGRGIDTGLSSLLLDQTTVKFFIIHGTTTIFFAD